MTTLSPWLVGIVDTRRSMAFLPILTWMRPSCGRRFLGDAHGAAHDLEAADDGRLQLLGRVLHLLEHAVDAETHAEAFFQRFQVDVARAVLYASSSSSETSLMMAESPLPSSCSSVASRGRIPRFLVLAERAQHHIAGLLGAAVVFDQRLLDLLRRGTDGLDLALEQERRLSSVSKFSGSLMATTSTSSLSVMGTPCTGTPCRAG